MWHDVECAAYAADLPLWRELAAASAGPVLDIGCGTGRVALDLAARGPVVGLDSHPDLVAELAARAKARSLPVEAVDRRRTLVRARSHVRPRDRADAGRAAARRRARARGAARGRPPAPRPGRAARARARRPVRGGPRGRSAATAPRRARTGRLGPLVEPGCGARGRRRRRDRPAAAGRLAGRRAERGARDPASTTARPSSSRTRARAAGLASAERHAVPPTAITSGALSSCSRPGAMMHAARLRPLPELMNIYADRGNIAVLRARCEWRGIGFELAASASVGEPLDQAAHDLFYMGGGQDRDQIAVADDMVVTKRDALRRGARPRRRRARGLRRLPAARRELPARRRGAARHRPRRSAHRPRGRPAPDRQLRDRGRPRRAARG